jgi:hypothetical protein
MGYVFSMARVALKFQPQIHLLQLAKLFNLVSTKIDKVADRDVYNVEPMHWKHCPLEFFITS